jgi:hypothetical protein
MVGGSVHCFRKINNLTKYLFHNQMETDGMPNGAQLLLIQAWHDGTPWI